MLRMLHMLRGESDNEAAAHNHDAAPKVSASVVDIRRTHP
jgi:hypothetical protein